MKKEIRNRRIVALVAMLVIGLAYVVSGQVKEYSRYDNRPDVKTYSAVNPIEIGESDLSDIIINMSVDVVTKDTSFVTVFIRSNNGIDLSKFNLIIKFKDDTYVALEENKKYNTDTYVEYSVDQDALNKFYNTDIDCVFLESVDPNESINIRMQQQEHKSFFKDILTVCFK